MAVYVDYEYNGRLDEKGNLPVLVDQKALENAIILWICSFRGERLYSPTKGGYIVGSLLKPMSEERSQDIREAIIDGLRNDFKPSVEVERCTVTPDYEHHQYAIYVEGFCPSFKTAVNVGQPFKTLAR